MAEEDALPRAASCRL